MVLLTKIDGNPVIINLETVKYIESVPDTLIFFLNGDSLIVKETLQEIIDKDIYLRTRIAREALELTPPR